MCAPSGHQTTDNLFQSASCVHLQNMSNCNGFTSTDFRNKLLFVNTLESSSVSLTKTRFYFIVEVFRPIGVVKKVEMGLNTQKRQRRWQDKRHKLRIIRLGQGLRTPNEAFFHQNPKLFGLGQPIWADEFWGIFGRFINTNFGTVSHTSMFSINQP